MSPGQSALGQHAAPPGGSRAHEGRRKGWGAKGPRGQEGGSSCVGPAGWRRGVAPAGRVPYLEAKAAAAARRTRRLRLLPPSSSPVPAPPPRARLAPPPGPAHMSREWGLPGSSSRAACPYPASPAVTPRQGCRHQEVTGTPRRKTRFVGLFPLQAAAAHRSSREGPARFPSAERAREGLGSRVKD